MANLNRAILVGNLATDPEGRSTPDGMALTKFRLSVDSAKGLSQDQNFQGETLLVDVITWRRLAENCSSRLKKGSQVLVEGRVQIRSFEDQLGQRRWVTEVVAREVVALGGQKAPQAHQPIGQAQEEAIEEADLESDLPF